MRSPACVLGLRDLGNGSTVAALASPRERDLPRGLEGDESVRQAGDAQRSIPRARLRLFVRWGVARNGIPRRFDRWPPPRGRRRLRSQSWDGPVHVSDLQRGQVGFAVSQRNWIIGAGPWAAGFEWASRCEGLEERAARCAPTLEGARRGCLSRSRRVPESRVARSGVATAAL